MNIPWRTVFFFLFQQCWLDFPKFWEVKFSLYKPEIPSQGLLFQNWNGKKKEKIKSIQAILYSVHLSAILMLFYKRQREIFFFEFGMAAKLQRAID